MITFTLNNEKVAYTGDADAMLLPFLREQRQLTALKDGCSGEGVCGACTVEINGRARLACTTRMRSLQDAVVLTPEGFPPEILKVIATAFVNKGAVQCGFCTPGFITRIKVLLQDNPAPSVTEIQKAIRPHLCRCTGYKKIEVAALHAAEVLRNHQQIEITTTSGKVGQPHPKYQAYEAAVGTKKFVDDLRVDGMLHAALRLSDHPRAKVLKIDTSEAEKLPGVVRIFIAADVPGQRNIGLIFNDWPLMIAPGETTHYIGDVLAGVVAQSVEIAREAAALIKIEYEVLKPITDMLLAASAERVHEERPNCFEITKINTGDTDEVLKQSTFRSFGTYRTQRIEHAFMEKESALAMPDGEQGVMIYSQSQGIYEDQRQIALLLGLPREKVRVVLVPNGGGFGGKEDLTVQGHAALFAFLLQRPVKLTLSRQESIRLHPKRHPVVMDIDVGADANGKLTAVRLLATGDTGAYASVGMKVMERVAGHATGGYFVPAVSIEARTVYTNNIPSGAMRGFGATQVCFAIESCIDDICRQAGFDRWQFRWDNALVDGLTTATGQKVFGVGIRQSLLAVKPDYDAAEHKGLACAIKNSGVGNGMIDESKVIIEIVSEKKVILKHGWTEMGQGVHNMALQTLCEETGIDPDIIEVQVDTEAQIATGMTTSSRATALVGRAVIDAASALKADLMTQPLQMLAGKKYRGAFVCDWTTAPGSGIENPVIHYSYGYAAQLCVLDAEGNIIKMVAAHDGGKVMNPMLFEGQIEGGVHMGLGYALTESLPMENGFLVSDKMRDLKILRAHETPEIVVKPVEVPDAVGPYGAKGIGEIGLVPTAAAIANAFTAFDGIRRWELPLKPIQKTEKN
ncbi:MAG TPA: selenium-dependent xanthine dehydrogenase [Bacteroidales bacterium]|nr:selenium-dependent xanthine dehydrogenase [Bacteroidales bacterium]